MGLYGPTEYYIEVNVTFVVSYSSNSKKWSTSLYNIHILSSNQVMRILKLIMDSLI